MHPLLIPRFKVIADYPFNQQHQIGQIIIKDNTDLHPEIYPHIFEELPWWKDRPLDTLSPCAITQFEGSLYFLRDLIWEPGNGSPFAMQNGKRYLANHSIPITQDFYTISKKLLH